MHQARAIEILKEGRKLYGLFLEEGGEHGNGLTGLYRFIGTPSSKLQGIEARTIPKTSWLDHALKLKDIQLTEKFLAPLPPPGQRAAKPKVQKTMVQVLSLGISTAAKSQAILHGRRASPDVAIAGAYNDLGFSLTAYSDEAKALMPRLQKALMGGDLAMWIGIKDGRRGLHLVIISKMPEFMKARLAADDARASELAKHAKDTAIERRLRRQAQKYAAKNKGLAKALETCRLTPLWPADAPASNGGKRPTRHPILFRLDVDPPFASGVFTVEELEQWLDGRGPIAAKAA